MKKIIKKMMRNKGLFLLYSILFLILTGATLYLLYSVSLLNSIETFLRICGSIFLIIIWFVFFLIGGRMLLKRKKNWKYVIFIFIILLYNSILLFTAYTIHNVYGKVNNITSNYTVYSTSIVTLKDNVAETLNDIGNSRIGILKDETSTDGNQIAKEIMKDKKLSNELVEYDGYVSLLNDLLDKKIDFIFLPTNYGVMFQSIEKFEKIESKTKIIYSQEKKVKKTVNKNKTISKPFTVLLMGVDSEQEDIRNSTFNGDALMLLTFNPTTLNTTILSIPRDTYVPIACFNNQRKNKITHAAWYGEDCMIKTIENFTDIKIDYYVKMNFKGVVKLVNALGGIEVDVPIAFCEQNSDRDFSKQICLKKGVQTLDGEAALALSRHRKTINDFIRGQNQQLVVKGIMNKVKAIRSLDTLNKLLDTIGYSMETNMSTDEILSFYNIGKDILEKSQDTDIDELLGMQRLYISGYDANIYDYSAINGEGTQLHLYDFVPYQGSIKDVVNAMKLNLELEKPKVIKTFSFDIDEPYKENVIGRGEYDEARIRQLPDFIGYSKDYALSYGQTHGIKIKVNYKTSSNLWEKDGEIVDQSIPYGLDLEYLGGATVTITVVQKTQTPIPDPSEPDDPSDIPDEPDIDDDPTKPLDPDESDPNESDSDEKDNTDPDNNTDLPNVVNPQE